MALALRRSSAIVITLLCLLLATPAAFAHITVNPKEATQGGFAKLTFRVPNERPDSGTVKVEVFFPDNVEIPFASVKPVPGWTFSVQKKTLSTPIESHGQTISQGIESVTWTGGPINPGEFQEFEISGGPMPKNVDRIVFRAIQTYASGEVVRWIEVPEPGQPEPDHPAPVLTLLPPGQNPGTGPTVAPGGAANTAGNAGSRSATMALSLAAAAAALALTALVVGFVAMSRSGGGRAKET